MIAKDLIVWAIAALIITGFIYHESKDFTAAATILLALSTAYLAKDSNKNIALSKDNLAEQRLEKEMDRIIRPLFKIKDEFEKHEYMRYPSDSVSIEFWKMIEADKYLAPSDLRECIETYLEACETWNKKLENIKMYDALIEDGRAGVSDYTIERFPDGERDHLHFQIFYSLPQKHDKDQRLQDLQAFLDQKAPKPKLREAISKLMTLINEDTVLEKEREVLRKKVIQRYNDLTKRMDLIRESLE